MSQARADRASSLHGLLTRRWFDRLAAAVALAPFVYVLWQTAREGAFDIPRLVIIVELVMIVVTMAARRPPVRVTLNPWYWLLAFAVTYWPFPTGTLEAGAAARPLAPAWISNGVALLSLAVSFWARLSLGRNIGILPAERRLVTRGAYSLVRHPIYTAIFIGVVAAELSAFSWPNLLFDLAWCGLWVLKTFVEEGFLAQNPEYVRYTKSVRWRWIPGVA